MEKKMLEDKLSFRDALLDYRNENEWSQYRPDRTTFYPAVLQFEGKKITGKQL